MTKRKQTAEEIEEQRQFHMDVDKLVLCRAIFDRELQAFVDRNGWAPTKIWTYLHPARFCEELWIGCCLIKDRTITFPRTLIFPKDTQ